MAKKRSLNEIVNNEETSTLVIKTPTKVAYPEEAIDFVVKNFKKKVKDETMIEDVRFAAGEMVANAIEHGNKRDETKLVKIYCSWFGDDFYFVVQDEGEGFDIENPRYKHSPPEGGLGIIYTKQRMDLVYNFEDSASYLCKIYKRKKSNLQKSSLLKKVHKFLKSITL